MTPEFVHAWIFLSIAATSSRSPASVRDVCAAADGINHAIPTHEELTGAFRWLTSNGLIEKAGREYNVSEVGRALLDSAKRKGTWATLQLLEARFAASAAE